MLKKTFLLSCWLAILTVPSMSASPPHSSPLVVTISTLTTTYRKSSDLTLDVQLRNESDEPITVFGRLLFGGSGGLILTVTDAAGKVIATPVLLDEQVPPAFLRHASSYVVLQPHHYLGTALIQPVKDLFAGSGTYRITIDYLSPVPRRYFTNGGKSFGRENGIVRSNSLTVHIE
jgi:hypothetical protein